jgi:hypothetical protein
VDQEAWDTQEKIDEAKRRLAARMPGWQVPAAYGIALVPDADLATSEVSFPVVNVPVHGLPALVLGLLTGRRHESATYELSPSQLETAIALLAPAEAARMMSHPNLLAWRKIALSWREDPSTRLVVVFIANFSEEVTSPYDEAVRRQIAAGDRTQQIHIDQR